jgi:serine/threonine protein kinase/Tol biopolymer transport system component
MTPADHKRAGELFEQLREVSEGEHASALDAACAGDPDLREHVWRLLEADRDAAAGSFLARRAIEDAAQLLMQGDRMPPLSPGTRLGPYEITGFLGAGGMGEVYRARDTNLDREVAIKVLTAALAGDARYMARFEREAKLLASLNHPNIATIYGIEQGAIVMELVVGENLRGPLPLEEAIPVARQIAVGLEAAHEGGVVHRDLKPANIKVTPSGVVKLLDFGLAKSASGSSADSSPPTSPSSSPPFSPVATQGGTIMGTAAYMSPEQARGKPVDKRADIWAFGVVLYELLTGRQLLSGVENIATALDNLPAETPPNIRRLLARCLRKDVNTRLRDIGEARLLLDDPEEALRAPEYTTAVRRTNRLPWSVAAAAIIGALAFGGLWLRPKEQAQAIRLSVVPPEKTSFSAISLPAVSPDGRHLAFVAGPEGKPELWIRDLDTLSARGVPGTEGAVDPFWSPDSRYVAFFVPGKLKKVAIDGSPAVTLCDAADGRGGSWSRNDVILFAPNFAAPLSRVSAAGGTVAPVTALDTANGESSHRFPWFLPDGRHFLYTARSDQPEKTTVYAGALDSKDRRMVVAAASNVAWSPPGYLLYMRERTLMGQAFDASALRTTGQPFAIAQQVDYLPGSIQGQFAVSPGGVLAYLSGGGTLHSQMTWLDRAGASLGTVGQPGIMQGPALSPDGRTVVVDRLDGSAGTYDIWLRDLAGGSESRLTFDPANEMFPVWSPDGSRILYSSDRNGKYGLYQQAATGGGNPHLLYETTGVTLATDWPDDHTILFFNTALKTGNDLWILRLTGLRPVPPEDAVPVLRTAVSESQGKLSPDGRWLAYESSETSSPNIYVQTFPGKESKWQVSSEGGTRPVWRRDGKELFYIGTDNKMMAVEVRSGPGFEHSIPKALFDVKTARTARYDVTRDGQRFLMLGPGEPEANAPMTVVLNWRTGLKK